MDFTGELEHARVHPKFLHSNATSHKWALGGMLNSSLESRKGFLLIKISCMMCGRMCNFINAGAL